MLVTIAMTFRVALAAALTAFHLSAGAGDQLPKLKATTLSGVEIHIPLETNSHPQPEALILTIGFSHDSDKAMEAWDHRIAPLYSNDSRIAYYELPVIEGAPGLIKPMIIRGMHKSVSKAEQTRMAPLTQGESALKKVTGFKEPNAAYVLVATADGKIVWITRAPVSDAEFAALRHAVATAVK